MTFLDLLLFVFHFVKLLFGFQVLVSYLRDIKCVMYHLKRRLLDLSFYKPKKLENAFSRMQKAGKGQQIARGAQS